MRRLAISLTIAFVAVLLCVVGTGEVLIYPAHHTIGPAPPDLAAESIELKTGANQSVAGWVIRGRPGFGAVLLLHGVRADRRDMIGRAKFLHAQGYSVLLIDLPAHGESAGDHITYGLKEGEGVTTALQYLRSEFPQDRIGVIGVSLGAASLILSKPDPPPNAVVLESMFPTIQDAVSDRLDLRFGRLGRTLAPLLLWQMPIRLGISPDQLRPIADLTSLHSPLLIASGSLDRHTTLRETQLLFATANEPKELWIINGAAHVNLYAFDPIAYESKVGAFLEKYLHGGG
jgi:uncharacterized protein